MSLHVLSFNMHNLRKRLSYHAFGHPSHTHMHTRPPAPAHARTDTYTHDLRRGSPFDGCHQAVQPPSQRNIEESALYVTGRSLQKSQTIMIQTVDEVVDEL